MREWVMSDCVGGGDERMGSVNEWLVVWLGMITTVVSFDADAIVRSCSYSLTTICKSN